MAEPHLSPDHILPTMDEWEVFPRLAVAVALKAQEDGIARLRVDANEFTGTRKQ